MEDRRPVSYKAEIEIESGLRFFTDAKFASSSISLLNRDKRSIRDLLESIGIPHVEFGRILLNGDDVDDGSVLSGDCRLEVFPAVPSFSDTFLLDVHLGKLATNLRMLGFDVDYSRSRDDDELADLSGWTGRTLLTCDRGLLMRRAVSSGMLVRSREPLIQTAEVIRRFCLEGHFKLFSRCINCGAELCRECPFDKLPASAAAAVPHGVRERVTSYRICSGCGRPYWEGSHFAGMYKKIDRIAELTDLSQQTSSPRGRKPFPHQSE